MENLKEVIEEIRPALERIKLLQGTTASAAAKQLLGEADHGLIPVFDEYGVQVSEHSGKNPPPGCRWAWSDSGLRISKDLKIRVFTSGDHWVWLDSDGKIIEVDSDYSYWQSRFWSCQGAFKAFGRKVESTDIERLVKKFTPALNRIKLLRGTAASAAAEQLLGEADHGFIPVLAKDDSIVVSVRSGKNPPRGCTWANDDSGIRLYKWRIKAYINDYHWVSLNRNGKVVESDPDYSNPSSCRYWSEQSEFISA